MHDIRTDILPLHHPGGVFGNDDHLLAANDIGNARSSNTFASDRFFLGRYLFSLRLQKPQAPFPVEHNALSDKLIFQRR
jgi:hypothetical protein